MCIYKREVAHEGHRLDLGASFRITRDLSNLLVSIKERIMKNETVEIVELTVEELEERTAPGIIWGI
jgi:hypothetical protein